MKVYPEARAKLNISMFIKFTLNNTCTYRNILANLIYTVQCTLYIECKCNTFYLLPRFWNTYRPAHKIMRTYAYYTVHRGFVTSFGGSAGCVYCPVQTKYSTKKTYWIFILIFLMTHFNDTFIRLYNILRKWDPPNDTINTVQKLDTHFVFNWFLWRCSWRTW